MNRSILVMLVAGCQGWSSAIDHTRGTGMTRCFAGDNPYVAECTVTLEAPGPIAVVLTAKGAPTRTFESTDLSAEHTIAAWGLRADTEYEWSAAGESGHVTTGETPFTLQSAEISVSGTLTGIDAVMVYLSCGYFAVIDGEGEIIGAVPALAYDGYIDGMRWSQADRSFLAASDARMMGEDSRMVEVHVSGSELLRLETTDLDLSALTHDLDRWGPYTYLLGIDDQGAEGFEVWEDTTWRGTYLLERDFVLHDSWLNGLSVSDDGQVILSERTNNAIISVDGDPDSPAFLTVNWHAAGVNGSGLSAPDYAPSGGNLYRSQHHASLHGDDLWVFDNDSRGESRALRMSMDGTTGEISETGSWDLGQKCDNQGGAFPVDGGTLTTCANSADVYLFLEDSVAPAWHLNATCGDQSFHRSTRAYPVLVE